MQKIIDKYVERAGKRKPQGKHQQGSLTRLDVIEFFEELELTTLEEKEEALKKLIEHCGFMSLEQRTKALDSLKSFV